MTHTGQNTTIYAGNSKILEFVVYAEDDITPLDITNATIHYVVYKPTTKEIKIEKSTGAGISITDALNGVFEVTLDPEDTENLLGYFNHEGELTDFSGNVSTIFTGYFRIYETIA